MEQRRYRQILEQQAMRGGLRSGGHDYGGCSDFGGAKGDRRCLTRAELENYRETGNLPAPGRKKKAKDPNAPRKARAPKTEEQKRVDREKAKLKNQLYNNYIANLPQAPVMIPYAEPVFPNHGQSQFIGYGKGGKSVASKKAAAKSPWIAFVKQYAAQHGMTYGEALSDPRTSAAYRAY